MDKKSLVYKGMHPDMMCGDTTFRILPNGDWAAFFVTGGSVEPHKDNYIVVSRSFDQGETWTKPETILKYHTKACLFSEVIVHGNKITMLAQTHGGMFDHWKVVSLTSEDNGKTWSGAKPFTAMPHRAFLRNLVITSWGEWIIPYQTYDDNGQIWFASPMEDDGGLQARNGVLISKDEGISWEKSASIGPTRGWAENNVVELADGTLVMLIRADGKGCLIRSESTDRGRTWSAPVKTDIPNPGTKFRLHKLSDGRIVLIHNPNPVTKHPNSKLLAMVNRNPLAMWISDDDMKTWGYQRVLTDFPGMLAYPDGVVDAEERYVHFIFDYNRQCVIYWGAELPDVSR